MLKPFATPLMLRAKLRDPGAGEPLSADSADPVWELLFAHAAHDGWESPSVFRPAKLITTEELPNGVTPGLDAPPADIPRLLVTFWGQALEIGRHVTTSSEPTPQEFFTVVASAYRAWREQMESELAEQN